MGDWISFFDSDHAIYVNARHKQVHALITGVGMLEHIDEGGRVLDYGCGEAAYAEPLMGKAGQLTLCEAAPNLRDRLKKRLAKQSAIAVLPPEDVEALSDASFDTIIMHSVSQYLSPEQFDDLLALFRRLLKPSGKLVIGDVVQPNTPAWQDALALLRFGWREGFFLAAVGGLFRTAFSGYAKLRKDAGLTRYTEHEVAAKLKGAGFRGERASRNIGHLQTRMTFVARPA